MQTVSETQNQKKVLIEEAIHEIELTSDEKKTFVWLYHQDLFTVSNICDVINKARCLDAKAK